MNKALENTTVHLIAFDGLEQRFKVSSPKAFVLFALNELKEDGSDRFFREDLEEQSGFVVRSCTIQEDTSSAQLFSWFPMSRQSFFEHIVVGAWWRRHEFHAARFQAIPAFDEVVARECDVLDAFAFVFTKVLFDLSDFL